MQHNIHYKVFEVPYGGLSLQGQLIQRRFQYMDNASGAHFNLDHHYILLLCL